VALSRRLGEDQPIYGFQAHGLEARGIPDWTVERTARRHLQMIRVLAPHGPYLLAGHSLGGLIAMEIAHMLRAAGEEVSLLVLLDTYLPLSVTNGTHADEQPTKVWSRLDRTLRPLPKVLFGDDVVLPGRAEASASPMTPSKAARGNATGALAGTGETAQTGEQDSPPARHLIPQGLLKLAMLRRAARVSLAGLVRYPGLEQFDVFFYHGRLLERFYRPRPWSGRTLVYLAEDNPDTDDCWSVLLTGSWESERVPTQHFAVLREPHIAKIAERISSEIDEIIAARTRA
jgi:thioesterase domain-containing protein